MVEGCPLCTSVSPVSGGVLLMEWRKRLRFVSAMQYSIFLDSLAPHLKPAGHACTAGLDGKRTLLSASCLQIRPHIAVFKIKILFQVLGFSEVTFIPMAQFSSFCFC